MVKKFSVIILSAMLFSCNTNVMVSENLNKEIIINQKENKFTIRGKAEFPINKNFSAKATLEQIGTKATVSLIKLTNNTEPDISVEATGLTDTNGNFIINHSENFVADLNQIYILEVSKRIGSSGNDIISLRTYIKWTGQWSGITTSKILINTKTTALSIIAEKDPDITPNDTIGKISIENNTSVLSPINSVTVETISKVSELVTLMMEQNADPIRFIDYSNNNYFIKRETSHNRTALINKKSCPGCDLSYENLSNLDLSDSDLTGANLNGAKFYKSYLNYNNLTGANISNADFSGSIVKNKPFSGNVFCNAKSIGECNRVKDFINLNNGVNVGGTIYYSAQSQTVISNISDKYISVWRTLSGGDGIFAKIINSDGTVFNQEFRVNDYTTSSQNNPSVSVNNNTGDFVVTWESEGQDGSGNGIYAKIFSISGVAKTSEFRVNSYTTGNQNTPSVAVNNNTGDFVVVWNSDGQDGSGNGIYVQKFNPVGVKLGSEIKVNSYTSGNQSNPSVVINNNSENSRKGDFVIVWDSEGQDSSGKGVYAKRYNSLGSVMNSEFKVNNEVLNNQENPVISSINNQTDTNYIVAWQSALNSVSNIYAKRLNVNSEIISDEFKVNDNEEVNHKLPTISVNKNNGDFIISWIRSSNPNGSIYTLPKANFYNFSGNLKFKMSHVPSLGILEQKIYTAINYINYDYMVSWNSDNVYINNATNYSIGYSVDDISLIGAIIFGDEIPGNYVKLFDYRGIPY